MNFEEFRKTIIGIFQDLHEGEYPSTLVDYPNKPRVDSEHQEDPWVRVELAINSNKQLCFGQTYTRIAGWLYVTTFVRTGDGTKWQTEYSDFLDSNFSLETISNILFKELLPLPGVGYPGWYAVRNVLPFTFEKYN